MEDAKKRFLTKKPKGLIQDEEKNKSRQVATEFESVVLPELKK